MKRRTAREKAMQVLFQVDVSSIDLDDAIGHVLEGLPSDDYFEKLVNGTVDNLEEIDELIKGNLDNWSFERLANVDRNIVRIAVYELKFIQETPTNVVLDEAIEIAKVYGDEQSSRFINAVLSKIKTKLEY